MVVQPKTFMWRGTGSYSVIVHSSTSPSDAEWDAWLDEFAADRGATRLLVHTEGGAPNAAQRVRLTAILKGRKIAVAVLTQSALARAAGAALRWIRPEIRMFAPDEIDAALDYLGANGADREELVRLSNEIKSKLDLSRTA